MEEDLDFFLDNNAIKKKKMMKQKKKGKRQKLKLYTITRIKCRDFISNISYN